MGVVVTCGNLPDLRSLTMPLIEELDVEVETLDSLEGLTVAPAATDRLSESAAAIRLACAGVIARATRPWDDSKRVAAERTGALVRIAAVLAILAGLGGAYAGYVWWRDGRGAASAPVATTAQARPPRASVQQPVKAPPSAKPPSASPPKPAPVPASAVTRPPTTQPPAIPPPTREAAPPRSVAAPAPPAPPPPLPPLLKDPLPRVTAILISTDRRFATVNRGQVIGVGDTLGRRVVVGIDERAIRLREPSGVEVRVGLGGRLLGAARGGSPRPATPEPGVPRPAAM